MAEETKKKEKEQRFEIVEVPTQMGLAYRDNEMGTDLGQPELLTQIANDVSEIKKGIVGSK